MGVPCETVSPFANNLRMVRDGFSWGFDWFGEIAAVLLFFGFAVVAVGGLILGLVYVLLQWF
jgi:hypothetical protein